MHTSEIVSALSQILGESGVIVDPARMGPYLKEPRRLFFAPALAVALPGDVGTVQRLAAWANENGVPLIPQGGNTGLVGAQVPVSGNELIVSLARLDAIRSVDAAAGHMTVEAGMILENVQKAAEAAGMIFPLWLGSQGSAQMGGLLGSNAGGIQVLSYGNARELCLGIEAVLADGRLFSGLSSLRKDNTGYDLKDLFIGAEGTLGIITAATLKLFPKPEGHETALCNVASPEEAVALLGALRARVGERLTVFELIPRFVIEMLVRHGLVARDPTASLSPWYVLTEVNRMRGGIAGALQAGLEEALSDGLIADAVIAESEADRMVMLGARESINEAQVREGASIKHDISVPIAAIPAMIARGTAAVERLIPDVRPCVFGHIGDGNLHFNFAQPPEMQRDAFMALSEPVHDAIYAIVLELGGSVSAEHGIGQLKVDLLRRVKDPVALDLMRSVKQALDPRGILNPGKMLV